MSEEADDLLLYGIAAAKANSRDEARNYLEWVLQAHGDAQRAPERRGRRRDADEVSQVRRAYVH